MSQLILMRQRISAIETIKKITHAMQLISMSTHSRLRQKKIYIEQYQHAINEIACSLQRYSEGRNGSLFSSPRGEQKIIIIVGSQKGLCGTFNANLYRFFKKHAHIDERTKIIIVGKLAADFFSYQGISPDIAYTNFSLTNYATLAITLTQNILADLEQLQQVTVYNMYQKSFFLQEPQEIILFPLTSSKKGEKCLQTSEEYLWEENPELILQFTQELNLQATILEALFDSLLAEQAARFISMESATRNAETLLNDMKLEYNKTRQAKITLELTDLVAGSIDTN